MARVGSMAEPEISPNPSDAAGFAARILRSVFPRPIVPRTERERRKTILDFFVLHLRPVRVRKSTLPYTHTVGLGGSSLTLIVLMIATGSLLMLAYEPTPERAYQSVVSLQEDVVFGGFVRNLHHWGANFLVLVVVAHMLRVFLTGAFHGARQFNWIIGLTLLCCVLVSNFTGYLLPWDQLSYWATTIVTAKDARRAAPEAPANNQTHPPLHNIIKEASMG